MRKRRLAGIPAAFVVAGIVGASGCAAPSTTTSDQFDLQKAQSLAASAAAFMREKAYGRAESQYAAAIKIAGRLDPPKMGLGVFKESSEALAGLYDYQRKYELEEGVEERLAAQMARVLDPADPDLRQVRQNLADLYVKHDKADKARVLFEQIADSHRAAGNIAEAQRFERLAGLEPVPEVPASAAPSSCPVAGNGVYNFSLPTDVGRCDNPEQLIRSNQQAAWDDCGRTFPGSTAANIQLTNCHFEPAGSDGGRSWSAGIVGTITYDCRRCPSAR